MKILYLFDTLNRGGAETSTLEIAKRLKNFTPIVVTIFRGTDLKFNFEAADIKVITLDFKNKKLIFKIYKTIQKVVLKEQPDIIHSNLFHADQYARIIGRNNKIPVINSFVNDSYSIKRYELLSLKGKISLNFYKLLDRVFARYVDHFISLTDAIILNNIEALNVDSKKVTVIPRGRDIEAMKSKINWLELKKIKKKFQGKILMLTVSRLLIRKGYVESIRAIDMVIKKYPNIHYLIAGEGHDRKVFQELITDLNLSENITLLGDSENVPTLLEAADFFIFPSHYEGQGGALVEAMAFGKKIIATRIPVLEESVVDRYSAILFEYRNPVDLANKIIYGLEHTGNMEEYAENAKKVAQSRFAINTVVEKHESVYKKIIS